MFDRRNWLYALIVAVGGFAGGLIAVQFTPLSALAAHHHDAGSLLLRIRFGRSRRQQARNVARIAQRNGEFGDARR